MITRVTSNPSGLSLGPAATRATNPYARTGASQRWSNTMAVTAMTTTPAATRRAETSFTGSGNENNRGLSIVDSTGQLFYRVIGPVTTPTRR